MDDGEVIGKLNKILTLEHGHLGMYETYAHFADKQICKTFRRFMEVEIEHISRLKSIIRNLGGEPSLLIESGDIIGRMFGVTINLADVQGVLRAYSFIEKKSHAGYSDLVERLEQDSEKRNQLVAEFMVPNLVESKLMYLWIEDKLQNL